MRLDGQRRFGAGDVVDVVVVGTGAGGGPLLARLAEAGLSVVALEAGRNGDPASYTPDEVAAADLYWSGERLSGGPTPTGFGGNNSGVGVGGSTLHWGAFVPRADARDLALRSLTGLGEDWPLTLAELVPYYAEVEQAIAVSGPSPYPWDPARRYPLPPVPRNAPAIAMATGCTALGIAFDDAPAAVVSRDVGARHACVNCGACHQGCFNGAKTSTDVTFLPRAVAAGAEIRPDCYAHTVERSADGRITGIVYRQDGGDHRVRCRALVLAAGAVETPRLLLHNALANGSGQVGRSFMAHVATQVWGRFPMPMRMNKGYPSSLITEEFLRPRGAGFVGGYLVQSLGVMPLTWSTLLARNGFWGPRLVETVEGYAFMAGLGINGECLPSESNRLTLSDETDATGVPKPSINFGYGPNERAIDAHATATLRSIAEAAGARDVFALQRSAHTIGTCRMGRTGEAAVVDPEGRSFEVPNLWICDNSVFPSSLAANPALTIMALSLRTADAMLRG